MEDFSGKLKSLSQNKYFAIVALVFFAFLTALILALITVQEKAPLVDTYQRQINSNSGAYQNSTPPEVSSNAKKSELETSTKSDIKINQANESQKSTDSSTGTSESTISSNTATADIISKTLQNAKPLPKVVVSKVTVSTVLPEKPTKTQIHQFKTSFSEEDVLAISNKLKLKKDVVDSSRKNITVYDLTNPGFLSFNTANGEFVFVSEEGLKLKENTTDPKKIASEFAKNIGLTNSCIKATATYVLASEPNTTFVELHCTPEDLGLPIYNSYGVLNIPLYNKLSSYKVGEIDINTTPKDPDVVSASDISGYKRPDEYNTIVVQIDDKTGSVLTSYSNIRFIKNTISVPVSSILSAEQAIGEFEKNNTALTLTTPIGEGNIDLNAVYANDTADADSATITDVALAFNGSPKLTAPTDSCPQWFLRGTMNSKTGYELGFVSLIPAVDDKRCTSSVLGTTSNLLATANTAPKDVPTKLNPCDKSSSLKYCTFVFKGPTTTLLKPTSSPAPIQSGTCPSGLNHAWKLNKCEYMVWVDRNIKGSRVLKARAWYWMIKPGCMNTFDAQSLSALFRKKKMALMKMRTKTVMQKCKRGMLKQCPINKSSRQSLSGAFCQHLTTASPAIYVYAKRRQKINVSIVQADNITFTNPALTDRASSLWIAETNVDGSLKLNKNITKKWLYYEYNKMLLDQLTQKIDNKHGYIVSKSDLESFVKGLSKNLNLTKTESANLLKEMKREAIYIDGNILKIQTLSQESLSKFLPLSVNPKPVNIYRFHFVLSKAQKEEKITPPRLPIIKRLGLTIVELGAVSYK